MRTEYAYIRHYVQKIWDEFQDTVDMVLHLGMADGWDFYSMEAGAFKEGFTSTFWNPREEKYGYYMIPDVAGKTINDLTRSEGRGLWSDAPVGLTTTVNVRKAVETCMQVLNPAEESDSDAKKRIIEVRPHYEAGPYCCGFIYYESLATCWRRGLKTRVMFSHVPGDSDRESLERGKDVVLAMIGAVCQQIVGNVGREK